jgi:predicted DNA-binding transcriptional regulator AlpA
VPNTETTPATSVWLNKSQVAKHLNISLPTLDAWMARDDRFPKGYRVGRSRARWRLGEIEQYLQLCREDAADA